MNTEDRIIRWSKLLQISQIDLDLSPLVKHSGELSHPDFQKIRTDAENLYQKWQIFSESELRETLEWLLTFYCKSKGISYISGMHELLAPFFLIGFQSVSTLYEHFEKFVNKVIPSFYKENGKNVDLMSKIFHNLLLYYDPTICNLLDSQLWILSKYSNKWFLNLFASNLEISLLLAFWELILIENYVELPVFFGLILIIRNRSFLLNKPLGKMLSPEFIKEKIVDVFITDLDELETLISQAKNLISNCPKSVLNLIRNIILGNIKPIDIYNIENSYILEQDISTCINIKKKQFIIDLREFEEYSKNHLQRSFCLPISLNLSTEEYWLVLNGLYTYFYEQTNLECEISILTGSGKEEQILGNNLALDLARRGIERISIIKNAALSLKSGHETEICHQCEINRNILMAANGSIVGQKSGKILSTIIYHLSKEDFMSSHRPTPINSEFNTPRNDPPILANKTGSMISTKMGSIADPVGISLKKSITNPIPRKLECLYPLEEISKGIKLIWGNQIYEGEVLFEQYCKDDLIFALHYAETSVVRALLTGNNNFIQIAHERIENAEKIADLYFMNCETKMPNEKYGFYLISYAEILMFKACSQIIKGNYIRASITLRKSWKQYELSEKYLQTNKISIYTDEIKHRMLFGKGIFNIILSMTNPYITKISNLVGIENSVENGFKFLYECTKCNGEKTRYASSLCFLCYYLLIYTPSFIPGLKERLEECEKIIRLGMNLYENSIVFIWLNGYRLLKNGDLNSAIKYLEKAYKLWNQENSNENTRISFDIGLCNFLKFDYENCIKYLGVGNTSEKSKFTQLLLGVSYKMIGKNDEFEKILLEMINTKTVIKKDKMYIKLAQKFMKQKYYDLFPFEIIYLCGLFDCLSKDWFLQAEKILNSVNIIKPEKIIGTTSFLGLMSKKKLDFDEFSLKLLFQAIIYNKIAKSDKSYELLNEIIKIGLEGNLENTMILPYALYEKIIIQISELKYKEASENIMKLCEYTKYEFHKELFPRIAVCKEIIEENLSISIK